MLGLALVAALPLAGCTSDADPKPDPTRVSTSAFRLVAFDSCERLTDDLRAAAKEAVGPWGFPGDGLRQELSAQGARTAADAAAAGAAVPAAEAPEHSGTNVHERGVDEPDIVKTDGRRIVTVDGGTLRVVDAASRRATGKLDLGAEGDADLLLAGDRALVLVTAGFGRAGTGKRIPPDDPRPTGPQVLLVDLAGAPRIISRFEGEGRLVDARQTGTVARVVLRTAPRITFPDVLTDEDKQVKANRKLIDKAPGDAWLPGWTVTTGADVETGRVGCGQVSRPPAYSGTSMVSVHTFDLTAPSLGGGDPVSVVADGDTVYGTATSLYIANDQRWRFDLWRGQNGRTAPERTEIYRFDLAGAAKPAYAAAGAVPGWLVNQYALSEWDGRLRVATTLDSKQASAVRVLERRGDELAQVGVVDGLGKGERIYSVRFIGPRGYVVTFRQTDPLYSVDLSDPAKPRVTGELKITGYSAHLQPAGDGRLLGIGQEATTDGVSQGTQISLFDVSDPAAPRRLAQHHLPGTQSEAEWDPHALLWWPKTGTLVVPILSYGPAVRGMSNAAIALRVTDGGIEEAGVLAQPADGRGQREWSPGIRRSLVIGETLWTMSEYGLMASDLSTLDRVGWVPND